MKSAALVVVASATNNLQDFLHRIVNILHLILAIAIMIMTKVNVDSREAELSWLGSWLVYLLVATVEIIISAANTTFNQVQIQIQIQKCIFFRFSSPASTKLT